MNVAFLILAHNNYNHLRKLISSLQGAESKFYVHIDKKSTLPREQFESNVYLLEDREAVYWYGYSTVRATIKLLKKAVEDTANDYFLLLSGVDYPIRPRAELFSLLQEGGEFINILKGSQPNKPLSRFEYYYFDGFDRRSTSFKTKVFILAEKALQKLKLKKKIPFQIFVGSQWFALSRSCVEFILKEVAENPSYEAFFKNSLVPDESFFQTIIGNSKFFAQTKANLTYTDWSTKPAPAIITEKHVEFFKLNRILEGVYGKSSPFFARKFDDDSSELVKRIDSELRGVDL
ncbi:beta-1,6-N-acetylglucosaminyltransferase [Rufibacter ruber]|uniref:beta-1,6-N-acetylglucosaminyltransferase n=1 Tax=Rufibacter ruber TaxID=1783499 RepID=UPI00082DFF87|nr:beta-1,6-N-acetylglucosaminyltransferase [Rufibacter ruber]